MDTEVSFDAKLALDSMNNIYICYTKNGVLNCANKTGDEFNISVLANNSNSPSIDIDNNNYIYISYHDDNDNEIKYLTNTTGIFLSETVQSCESP